MSGEPAKDWYRFNADWLPTLCLGHSKQEVQVKDPEAAEVPSRRAAERRNRLLKIEELGKTIEEIMVFPGRRGWVKTSKKIEQQMLSKPTVKLKMRVKHRSIVSKQRWTLALKQ